MNKKRRKVVDEALALMEQARDLLESIADEEREVYDNMPESLQGSERGELTSQWADALETARDNLTSDIDTLQGVE